MNTNKVKSAKLKSLFAFPATNTKRVFTVHYMNMMVILSADESALLNFLIKESTVYNTFKYSTSLLKKHQKFINAIEGTNPKIHFKTNIHFIRNVFIKLVEKGLVFRVGNQYVINYNLTFMPQFSADVKRWINQYQPIQATNNIEFMITGIDVLNEQILKQIRN